MLKLFQHSASQVAVAMDLLKSLHDMTHMYGAAQLGFPIILMSP